MRPFLRVSQDKRRRSSTVAGADLRDLSVPGGDAGGRRTSLAVPDTSGDPRARKGSFGSLTTAPTLSLSSSSSALSSLRVPPPSPRRHSSVEDRKYPLRRLNTGIELRKGSLFATLLIIMVLMIIVVVCSYFVKLYWPEYVD